MIQVVVATHAGFGKAALETAGLISGGTAGVRTIELYPGSGAEDVEEALREQISALSGGDALLCMVDIPGGTPARVAAALALEMPSFHVVSGLNLGMLTETLLLKDSMDITQLKEHIIATATDTITDLGKKLRANISEGEK